MWFERRRPTGASARPCETRHTPVTDTPLLELRGISKSFGSVQALTDVDFEVRERRGDGARRRQRRRQVDADQVRRRDPPDDAGEILFDGQPVTIHGPEGRGQARDRGRLPGPRALRQPRRRAEHVPRPRGARLAPAAEGAADGGADGRDARVPRGDDDQLDPPAGRDALRRPAPVRRGRPRRDVELAARDPRRADGRARRRRRPSRCSSSSGASPSRGSPSCSSRTTCTTSSRSATRITVLRLGRDVGVYERGRTTQEEVVHAITAGVPTKVAGIPGHGARRRPREHRTPPPSKASRGPDASATGCGPTSAAATWVPGPSCSALALDRRRLRLQGRELLHGGQLHEPDRARWRATSMLAFGVVFVLLIGEIDLSIAYVSGIAGVVVAQLQNPIGRTPSRLALHPARVAGDHAASARSRESSSPRSACRRSSSRWRAS